LDNAIIIGGGYSALIAQILLSNQASTQVICPNQFHKTMEKQFISSIRRRSALEINKLLGIKQFSYGTLGIQFKNAKLHDRLGLGGNSSIWGGFFDIHNVAPTLIETLQSRGIYYEKLSFAKTGSISNRHTIGQLQDQQGKTIDALKLIGRNTINEYVTTFQPLPEQGITVYGTSHHFQLSASKVILAISPIQLLDLLYRSRHLQDGDVVTLTEFDHALSLSWTVDPYQFDTNDTIIRYKISRAMAHALGIQQNINSNEPSKKWLLPYIDQTFGKHKATLNLAVQDAQLIEIPGSNPIPRNFGSSIHYCDMHINGQSINDFLLKISPDLQGIGMAFVKQLAAGPISNDILIDAASKLSP